MRIVVLDGHTLNPGDNPWDEVSAQGDFVDFDITPAHQILERAKDADIILTNKTPLSAETLAKLPKLKFIGVLATGYNVIDIKAARARNIPVSNVPIYGTDAVAQHVFCQLLTLIHNPSLHDAAVRDGQWQSCGHFCFWKTPLVELGGKKMGLIGFGRIGRRVAEVAHAFGMEVIAYDVIGGDHPGYEPFAWKDLEEVFREADVVSLHCPQTDDNTGFVNARLLRLMKPTAYFLNTARGQLVNEQDLADALNAGEIAGAALDVVSAEPISKDNPLLKAKNCLITPHIAWAALEARKRLMSVTANNVASFIKGKPINVVN